LETPEQIIKDAIISLEDACSLLLPLEDYIQSYKATHTLIHNARNLLETELAKKAELEKEA
jgi:hypothetical protein